MATIGHTKGVAAKLGISNRTIEHHLSNARQKLGCESTIQAINLLTRPLETRSVAEPNPDAVKSDAQVENRPHPRIRRPLLWAVAILGVGTFGLVIALRSSSLSRAGKAGADDAPSKIIEDFEYNSIDPRWTVKQGNNRVATVNGDYLRYELTQATLKDPRENNTRAYTFFSGRDWRLSFKVKYSLPGVHNGRQQWFRIDFDENVGDPRESLNIEASKDVPVKGQDLKSVPLMVSYSIFAKGWPSATQGPIPDIREGEDVWFEIDRHGSFISLKWSKDGADGRYSNPVTSPLDPETGDIQSITIWGSAYDDPKDPKGVEGWADYDYVHLEPVVEEPR